MNGSLVPFVPVTAETRLWGLFAKDAGLCVWAVDDAAVTFSVPEGRVLYDNAFRPFLTFTLARISRHVFREADTAQVLARAKRAMTPRLRRV